MLYNLLKMLLMYCNKLCSIENEIVSVFLFLKIWILRWGFPYIPMKSAYRVLHVVYMFFRKMVWMAITHFPRFRI